MHFVLLADIEKFFVFIVVIAIYIVAHFVNSAREQKPAPKRPTAPPPLRVPPRSGQPADRMSMEPHPPKSQGRPPQAQGSDPRMELDRFLEELGVRSPKGQTKPPPPPTAAKLGRRERPRPKPPAQEARTEERAADRHLKSQLEQRHTEDVHSDVESQHLQTHVHAVQSTIGGAVDSQLRSRPAGDAILMNLVRNKDTLARSLVLGMVLGPPNALRDDKPVI